LQDTNTYQRAIERWENEGGPRLAGGEPPASDRLLSQVPALHPESTRALKREPKPTVLTVGHSMRPLDDFIALLSAHRVTHLIDVRTVPRSRHNPQFNRDTLPDALAGASIHYTHEPGLGGFRHADPESPNRGWRNASFRGYADYMQTAEFTARLESLMTLAGQEKVALMCAEAVPWRCHRSLIADALLVHGLRVEEIINATRSQLHKLTPFARVNGTAITYPPLDPPDSVHSDKRQ
jgi:hypothetical protein